MGDEPYQVLLVVKKEGEIFQEMPLNRYYEEERALRVMKTIFNKVTMGDLETC